MTLRGWTRWKLSAGSALVPPRADAPVSWSGSRVIFHFQEQRDPHGDEFTRLVFSPANCPQTELRLSPRAFLRCMPSKARSSTTSPSLPISRPSDLVLRSPPFLRKSISTDRSNVPPVRSHCDRHQ